MNGPTPTALPMTEAFPGQRSPALLRRDEAGVATLILNRPESRNSLSFGLLGALEEALAAIATDTSVRAVVLAAAGPVFCAGHDLRELTGHRADADGGRAFFVATMERCAAVMQALVALPQPVIAAVQGVATAAGCQLVASCDLAVASAKARFCTPGVDIGLFCSTPAVALSRAVARKPALEMLLLGDMVPAEEALRIGLVNRVVSPDSVLPTAMGLARRIAERSALTVRMGKQAFNRQAGMALPDAYAHASSVMVENLMAGDAAEGVEAFLGKRRPVWQDR